MTSPAHTPITPKLVDSLYLEAMTLADEARGYFDREGAADRGKLDPVARVAFSCESLKVTTRLMHVVSWLLVRKAVQAGELDAAEAAHPDRRLGRATDSDDPARLIYLPAKSREIVDRSRDLYDRVSRLDVQLGASAGEGGPNGGARALLDRLRSSI
jgi:regulator of CtrA degradation